MRLRKVLVEKSEEEETEKESTSDGETFLHEQFYRPINLRQQIKKTGMGFNRFAAYTGISLNTLKRMVQRQSARRPTAERIAAWYWMLVDDKNLTLDDAFKLLFEPKPRERQRCRRARP